VPPRYNPPGMQGIDGRVIIDRTREVLAQIEAMGLDWKAPGTDRFARYLEALELISNPPPGFLDKVNDKDDETRKLIMIGASHVLQLQLAGETFPYLDPELLKRNMKKILAGPPIAQGDDDEPTDTLLEMVAAANALDYGFKPSLTAVDEDVRLHHPALGQGALECKRPRKPETLRKNLTKIGNQLRERQDTGSTYGMAVIGADRLLELADGRVWACRDLAEERAVTKKMMNLAVNAFFEESEDPKCRLVPPAIAGIVVLCGAVAISQPRAIRPFSQIALFPLPGANIPPDLAKLLGSDPIGPVSKKFRSE
jgi:hypothetical protein